MKEWLKLQFEAWIERREHHRLCETCEVLKEQLFISNTEKAKLLEQLIELTNPAKIEATPVEDYKPIQPKIVPWHIKKQMLEAESRAEAKILRDQKVNTKVDDLEEEVMKLAEEKLVGENNG
jgi:hypothetical protein